MDAQRQRFAGSRTKLGRYCWEVRCLQRCGPPRQRPRQRNRDREFWGGKSKLIAPFGAPVLVKEKAFDAQGPRRRDRAFETKWIRGNYVASRLLDGGHVVHVPGSESKREHFLHTFHARARLHDPGPPRDHLEVVEPPKPRRRITTKTQEDHVEMRTLNLSQEEMDQYANAKAKLIRCGGR